jgi:hypothetical protein
MWWFVVKTGVRHRRDTAEDSESAESRCVPCLSAAIPFTEKGTGCSDDKMMSTWTAEKKASISMHIFNK